MLVTVGSTSIGHKFPGWCNRCQKKAGAHKCTACEYVYCNECAIEIKECNCEHEETFSGRY